MPRPATQNERDCAAAKRHLDKAYDSIARAWNLIVKIQGRESEQHASTGRTGASQAKRRKRSRARNQAPGTK